VADDALLDHVVALSHQFVLDKLWIPIGVDNNGRLARLEVNAMIEVARRRQPGGNGEDILEVAEQGGHEVCGRHGVDSGRRAGCGHATPLDPVIITPTAHTSAGEIPENWPKGAQPLNPEHHLIAGQGNDEEVQHKFLRVDEELDVGADASAGHPVAIGDGYLEPGVEQRLEWRRHAVSVEMKEWVEPESTRAMMGAEAMVTSSFIVSAATIPVIAWREMRGEVSSSYSRGSGVSSSRRKIPFTRQTSKCSLENFSVQL
jgi:hypothetical protein